MTTEKGAIASGASKPSLPIGKRITHFLVSMKLALTLLFVIALLSIIGTILPQKDQVLQSEYWQNSPLYDFYKTLGLFDMYNSLWFRAILILLMANMTVCISKRLPRALKNFTRPRLDVKDVFISSQPLSATIPGVGDYGLKRAVATFSKHHYRVRTGKTGSVMAEKGRFSPLASICFHMSFLVMALGFIIGHFGIPYVVDKGFDESLEIPDGRTAAVPFTDMQVKNNGFKVEYEDIIEKDTGRLMGSKPKLFSSDLQVIQDGNVIESKVIEVNDPLRIKTYFYDLFTLEGINFHQSSFYRTSRGYVTVLQVNQMPGKNIIYLGFIMLMAGISFAIYVPHRRVWIKTGDKGELLIGGRSNRSKVSFQKDFDHLTSEIRSTIKQEDKS